MFKKFFIFSKNNIFRFISFILIFFCLFTSISTINKKKASANPLAIPLSYGLYEVVIYLLGAVGMTGVISELSEFEYSLLVEHMAKWVTEDGRLSPYLLFDATKVILLGRDLQDYCPDFIKDFIKEVAAFNGYNYSEVQELVFNEPFTFYLSPVKDNSFGYVRDIFTITNDSTNDITVDLQVSSDMYYNWQDDKMSTPLRGFSYSIIKNIPAGCKFTSYVRCVDIGTGYKVPTVVLVNYNMSTGECVSRSSAAFDQLGTPDFECRLFGSDSFYAGTFEVTAVPSSLDPQLLGSICVDGVINLPKLDEGIGDDVIPYLDADSISISNSKVNANELVGENTRATDVANELGYSGTLGLSDSLTNESEIDKADTKEIELPGEDNINKDDYSTPKKIKLNFTPLYLNLKDKFPFCLPWDLYNVIKGLVSEKKCPSYEISFADTPLVGGKNSKFTIDFKKFDKLINILRYFELLAFVAFLIKKTNDLLGRG